MSKGQEPRAPGLLPLCAGNRRISPACYGPPRASACWSRIRRGRTAHLFRRHPWRGSVGRQREPERLERLGRGKRRRPEGGAVRGRAGRWRRCISSHSRSRRITLLSKRRHPKSSVVPRKTRQAGAIDVRVRAWGRPRRGERGAEIPGAGSRASGGRGGRQSEERAARGGPVPGVDSVTKADRVAIGRSGLRLRRPQARRRS